MHCHTLQLFLFLFCLSLLPDSGWENRVNLFPSQNPRWQQEAVVTPLLRVEPFPFCPEFQVISSYGQPTTTQVLPLQLLRLETNLFSIVSENLDQLLTLDGSFFFPQEMVNSSLNYLTETRFTSYQTWRSLCKIWATTQGIISRCNRSEH